MKGLGYFKIPRVFLGATLALVAANAANTQSAAKFLTDYGMIGRWANDCSQPASPDNFNAVFASQSNGEVKRTYYNGPDKVYNEYKIVRAKLVDDHKLWYEQFAIGDNPSKHMIVVVEKKENKYHVIRSEIVGGDALVAAGAYTEADAHIAGTTTGETSPWQEKCP